VNRQSKNEDEVILIGTVFSEKPKKKNSKELMDGKGRIYVKELGFEKGDHILYIEHDGEVYFTKTPSILGSSTVDDQGRVVIPKKVARILKLNPGDKWATEPKRARFELRAMKFKKIVGLE